MKQLVKHLLRTNAEEIVSKSLLNCHCPGVHSIMLLDSPGKTIRLYIAVPGHHLDRNFPTRILDTDMSVGFHSHHCDITIQCIKGELINLTASEEKGLGRREIKLDKFLYHSKITKEKAGFEHLGKNNLFFTQSLRILPEHPALFLPANEIHTVACASEQITAWFVFEGKEDLNYQPFTWSNADLCSADFSGLYQKPTIQDIQQLLKQTELI